MTYVQIKLIIAGEGHVGKTCLGLRYKNKEKDLSNETPSVFEAFVHEVEHPVEMRRGNETIKLEVTDVDVSDAYPDYEGPLADHGASVFLLCKSVCDRYNKGEGWRYDPDILYWNWPVILVGNKSDLRDQDNQVKIEVGDEIHTFDEGVELAREIGAAAPWKSTVEYMECSAKTGEGVEELFKRAAEIGFGHYVQSQPKSCLSCHIL